MSPNRPAVFGNLAERSENFLLGWAEKERENLKTFKRIWRLKELAYRPIEEFPDLAERFRFFEEWLGADGMELAASQLTRFQMEEVSAALEKLKLFLPRMEDSPEAGSSSGKLSQLAEKFVSRLSGAAAVRPAISPKSDKTAADVNQNGGDQAEDFKKLLRYELEYMEQYRRPGEHLLSVIGRLLEALSARYHPADEVFVAHLIYFLQAQNYPVGPYLEKFRQIKNRAKSK